MYVCYYIYNTHTHTTVYRYICIYTHTQYMYISYTHAHTHTHTHFLLKAVNAWTCLMEPTSSLSYVCITCVSEYNCFWYDKLKISVCVHLHTRSLSCVSTIRCRGTIRDYKNAANVSSGCGGSIVVPGTNPDHLMPVWANQGVNHRDQGTLVGVKNIQGNVQAKSPPPPSPPPQEEDDLYYSGVEPEYIVPQFWIFWQWLLKFVRILA